MSALTQSQDGCSVSAQDPISALAAFEFPQMDSTTPLADSFPSPPSGELHWRTQSESVIPPESPRRMKRLKRKNGLVNLNPARPLVSPHARSFSISGSSAPSSPPPLSPSNSLSVMSQRSESELEGSLSVVASSSFSEVNTIPEAHEMNSPEQLDTLHDYEEHETPTNTASRFHSKSKEDSYFAAMPSAQVTISHDGTPFEILNPRKSLKTARIVSFIEDTDRFSILTGDRSGIPIGTYRAETLVEEDESEHNHPAESSSSSFTAQKKQSSVSLHSSFHYLPSSYSTETIPKIPSPSPGMDLTNPYAALPRCRDLPRTPRHLIRPGPLSNQPSEQSIRDRAMHDGRNLRRERSMPAMRTRRESGNNNAHLDLVGDFSDPPIPSISERLDSHSNHPFRFDIVHLTPIPNPDGGYRIPVPGNGSGADQDEMVIHTWLPKPGTEAMRKHKRKVSRNQMKEKMSRFGFGWMSSLFRSGN
ncbi:hypothetical protein MPDQ_000858 [Monascus purpureus]|uniref:Uncharacterized protein n=1 Tax=Monascus purpureus TaxID=5098 RepID=A0A507R5A2_MONPU|nr:hypothetical protein MPDQ_000858 [Monascus purpureus]BDD55684.1 hypothetical protein MAP00_001173 [Monascus purpureus]